LNAVLDENVRQRLKQDEHVTYTLLRFDRNGLVTFAGAHEEILIWRAQEGRCERVHTPGPWLVTIPSIANLAEDSSLRLEPGDIMVLYTDGVTEAMNAKREQYGLRRLCAEIERLHAAPVADVRDQVIDSVSRFQASQRDDLTLMVVRKK
jgi:serine phosphatase RsbU (regulator of sigma subunit)